MADASYEEIDKVVKVKRIVLELTIPEATKLKNGNVTPEVRDALGVALGAAPSEE